VRQKHRVSMRRRLDPPDSDQALGRPSARVEQVCLARVDELREFERRSLAVSAEPHHRIASTLENREIEDRRLYARVPRAKLRSPPEENVLAAPAEPQIRAGVRDPCDLLRGRDVVDDQIRGRRVPIGWRLAENEARSVARPDGTQASRDVADLERGYGEDEDPLLVGDVGSEPAIFTPAHRELRTVGRPCARDGLEPDVAERDRDLLIARYRRHRGGG